MGHLTTLMMTESTAINAAASARAIAMMMATTAAAMTAP